MGLVHQFVSFVPMHKMIYSFILVVLLFFSIFYVVPSQSILQGSKEISSIGSIRGRTCVLWYDYLTGDSNGPAPDGEPNAACLRIAAMKPTILYTYAYLWGWVGGDPPLGRDGSPGDYWYNAHWGGLKHLTPEVVNYLHIHGVKVIAYVPTFFAGNDPRYDRRLDTPDGIFAQIDRDLECGVDGFKFDEVHTLLYGDHYEDLPTSSYEYQFYEQASDYVRSKGNLLITFNTGTEYNSEDLMKMCDILSMEAAWDLFTTDSRYNWRLNYDSNRFEGYNHHGYNPELTMTSGLEMAISLTLDAWNRGIGYHECFYDVHGHLPNWWEDYMTRIGFP